MMQTKSALGRNRDVSFDVLRGIGILLMVMGHTGFGQIFDKYIHGFHMPIFFFTAGYFFNPERYTGYGDYIKRDLRAILLPYTVMWAVCQVLHFVYVRSYDVGYGLLSYFTSNYNRIDVAGAGWFLLCFFVIKQLFYWLHRLCKGKWLVLAVVSLSLLSNVLRQFGWIPKVRLPLCLDSAMASLPYMYLGLLLRQNRERGWVKRAMCLPWWAVIPGLGINFALILLNRSVNIRTNYYGIIPLYWLCGITAIWLWLVVSKKLTGIKKKPGCWLAEALSYFGRNSITYLVLNEVAIFAGFVAARLTGVLKILPPYGVSALVLVFVLLGLALANEVISRTKLRVLIGK